MFLPACNKTAANCHLVQIVPGVATHAVKRNTLRTVGDSLKVVFGILVGRRNNGLVYCLQFKIAIRSNLHNRHCHKGRIAKGLLCVSEVSIGGVKLCYSLRIAHVESLFPICRVIVLHFAPVHMDCKIQEVGSKNCVAHARKTVLTVVNAVEQDVLHTKQVVACNYAYAPVGKADAGIIITRPGAQCPAVEALTICFESADKEQK